HHGDPEFRRAFALSHARFRRLLGHRLVRKNADPELSAAFDEPRDGNPAGFDLPVRDPAGLERLQAKIPERKVRAAPRLPAAAPALLLPILNFARHQHSCQSSVLSHAEGSRCDSGAARLYRLSVLTEN